MRRREYSPRLRFWLLQGTLCLVLAGTLALARVVQRMSEPDHDAELAQALAEIGPLKLRMLGPVGWLEQRSPDGMTLLEHGTEERRGRRLRIWHSYGTIFMSPLEFLVRSGELSTADAAILLSASGSPEKPARLGTITMAGSSGVVVSQTRLFRGIPGQPSAVRSETVAATVLPTGDALLIRLDGDAAEADDDLEFIAKIAATIELPDAKEPAHPAHPPHPGKLKLEGVNVTVPHSLSGTGAADPLRTGNPLILSSDSMWLGVDVAPCIVLPDEGLEALPVRLAVRDPLYRPGPVKQLDKNTVMCERRISSTDGTGGLFPAVSYLYTDATGRGVLVEFRWNATAPQAVLAREQVQSLWSEISRGIRFADQPPVADLLQAGEGAVQSLPRDPGMLEPAAPPTDRWQWFHGSLGRVRSVRMQHQVQPEHVSGSYDGEGSPPLSGVGRETGHWSVSRDELSYTSTMSRIGPARTVFQDVTLRERKLQITITESPQAATVYAESPSRVYVPAGLLPIVLGRIERKPVVLQTDGLPNPTGWTAPAPVTVLATPASDMPRQGEDGGELSCWKVEVTGSGRSSRWYYDSNRQLQSIMFPGGVYLQRAPALPETRPARILTTHPSTLPTTVPSTRPASRPNGGSQGASAAPELED